MHVGFTGTQEGMTEVQRTVFYGLLEALTRRHGIGWLHHGDCIGADSDAHDVARGLGWKVALHPPIKGYKRAFRHAHESKNPLPYPERNLRIVRDTEMLIATPNEDKEQLRSGTWSTIRRARDHEGRTVLVIFPDGTVEQQPPF